MKSAILITVILSFAAACQSCGGGDYQTKKGRLGTVIVGEFPRKLLEAKEYPWFTKNYLKTKAADRDKPIQGNAPGMEVLVFMGTWCSDTHKYLPEFSHFADRAGITEKQIKLIGLDRDKKLLPLTEQYKIEKVPTFVFLKDQKEIGRIIEKPKTTMRQEMQAILSKSS